MTGEALGTDRRRLSILATRSVTAPEMQRAAFGLSHRLAANKKSRFRPGGWQPLGDLTTVANAALAAVSDKMRDPLRRDR
jgi:hypothetical protein